MNRTTAALVVALAFCLAGFAQNSPWPPSVTLKPAEITDSTPSKKLVHYSSGEGAPAFGQWTPQQSSFSLPETVPACHD